MIKQFTISDEQFKRYVDTHNARKVIAPGTITKINKQRIGHIITIDGRKEDILRIVEELIDLNIIDSDLLE